MDISERTEPCKTRLEQRDLKRGTEPRTWDYHIREKDEFKVLTKLRST
jgi:O-succinylbenzoate synthase